MQFWIQFVVQNHIEICFLSKFCVENASELCNGDCIISIDQWLGEKNDGEFLLFLINELVMGNLWLLVTFVKSMAFFWENMVQSNHIVVRKK